MIFFSLLDIKTNQHFQREIFKNIFRFSSKAIKEAPIKFVKMKNPRNNGGDVFNHTGIAEARKKPKLP